MKKNGVYGYWDTKKECVVYIGKDSNIINNKLIKIGINFFDFTSIEIIDNLIKEAI